MPLCRASTDSSSVKDSPSKNFSISSSAVPASASFSASLNSEAVCSQPMRMAVSVRLPFSSYLMGRMVSRSIMVTSLPVSTGMNTGQTETPKVACSWRNTRSNLHSSSSHLLTKKARGMPASQAMSHASSVPTSTPALPSTQMTAASATRTACLTSPVKSRKPGVSRTLIRVSFHVMNAGVAASEKPRARASGS